MIPVSLTMLWPWAQGLRSVHRQIIYGFISSSPNAAGLKTLQVIVFSYVWWDVSVIQAFERLRQKDHEFKVNIGYIVSLKLARMT